MERDAGLGGWRGPFWSRVQLAVAFAIAALVEWLVRRDEELAACWCFVAFIAAAMAVGEWHEARTRPLADPGDPEPPPPDDSRQR